MYAKLFPELYTGSMIGAGCVVFAIWPYALANCDAEGYVELNPKLLAMVLGASVQEIQQAIDFLMRPDPDSRSKAEDGRRIVKEGQFLYRLVNYEKYRAIRDKQDRREYQREWDRKKRPSGHKRSASPTQSDTVRHSPTGPTQAEAEAEVDKEESRKKKPASRPRGKKTFTRPTAKEVNAYAAELGYNNFAEPNKGAEFVAFYEERGWKDSNGRPVKDWKAKLRSVWLSKMKKPQRGDYYWLPTEEQVDEIYAQCAEVSA